eukprot:5141110-Prymnesium_polylepis.3
MTAGRGVHERGVHENAAWERILRRTMTQERRSRNEAGNRRGEDRARGSAAPSFCASQLRMHGSPGARPPAMPRLTCITTDDVGWGGCRPSVDQFLAHCRCPAFLPRAGDRSGLEQRGHHAGAARLLDDRRACLPLQFVGGLKRVDEYSRRGGAQLGVEPVERALQHVDKHQPALRAVVLLRRVAEL